MLLKSSGSKNKRNKKLVVAIFSQLGCLIAKKSHSSWAVFSVFYKTWISHKRIFLLTIIFMLVSWLAYSSTLKLEATWSSELSVDFKGIIRKMKPFLTTAVRISNSTFNFVLRFEIYTTANIYIALTILNIIYSLVFCLK